MDMQAIHWMSKVIQTMDHGLVIIDPDYKVEIWNEFMESFSGILNHEIRGNSLLDVCPELNLPWFKKNVELAIKQEIRLFIAWQQHPHLFNLTNYKPLTGGVKAMYQDVTLMPLRALTGKVNQLALLVYDTTEIAQRASNSLE